tara:strand:- start:7176 stop:13625 length:6450 start_codon:yes stop_codon:yes gene_type:complete
MAGVEGTREELSVQQRLDNAKEEYMERLRSTSEESDLNFISPPLDGKIELPTPNFEGATHFCQSITKIFSSFDAGALPVGQLTDGIQLKAIELDLGENFEFGLFEDSNQERYFLKESDVQFLNNPDYPMSRIKPFKKLKRVVFDRFSDFKSAGFNIPFFKDDSYLVKFDTGMKNKEEVMNRIEDFKLLGVKEILDYYGKDVADADIGKLRDAFGFINFEEILTPTRKGASHELVLSIKSKYLDALPDRNIAYFQNFYENVLSVNFKSRDFSNIISNLSKVLKKNHNSISKFSGVVEGIDLKKLSDKNFEFFNGVKNLLKENGYVLENLNTDSKMEFGFDPTTLELAYITMFDGENPGKFLNIGINKLSLVTDTKISKLMLNAKNILNSQESGMPWQQFLSTYFGGDYLILFNKLKENLGLNIPISDLEDTFNQFKDQYTDPFKDAKDALDLSNLVESEQFKDVTSQILSKARNQIGDNFLLNLPEIIANIDDLESLYQLVFDKISVDDLASLLLEKASEELGVQDINEIIARAVMKKMEYERLIDMIFESLTEENLKIILEDICLNYDFGFEEIETILETFETNLLSLILHYDDQGNLQGMLTDNLPTQAADFVLDKINELGYTDCISLLLNLKYRDVFEKESAREIICKILQGEIPTFTNPCPEIDLQFPEIGQLLRNPPDFQSMKLDIKASLKKLGSSSLRTPIDLGIKRLFKRDKENGSTDFFQALISIPKFRLEFDKESKTRNKLFKRNSGVGIDIELNRSDKGFSLQSLKSVNPNFDFSSFEIGGIDDIFGSVMEQIESNIKSGIEASLVSSFKILLNNLLESLRGGLDLSVPDFGGESISELFDASNGTGFDLALEGLLPKFEGKLNSLLSELKRRGETRSNSSFTLPDFKDFEFLPRRRLEDITGTGSDIEELGIKIGVLDPIDLPSLGDLSISKQDIADMLQQISDGLKPKEVFEFMRGNTDDREYSKIFALVQDPKMKLILDKELVKSVSETCSELVDLDLIDEIESIYDSRAPIGELCENLGLNYGLSPYPDVKTLGEELAENYEGISEDDIAQIMQDLLDKIKDNVSDAIGKTGNIDLPFNSDPDSFMPSPSDIPAMDFANDVVIDAIFDPIKKEYKREAATYADNLVIPSEPEEYVKMYFEYGDGIVTGFSTEDGLQVEPVRESFKYNLEFETYYKNLETKLYKKSGNEFIEYEGGIEVVENVSAANYGENKYIKSDDAEKGNIYVKKDTIELQPPDLKGFLRTFEINITTDTGDYLYLNNKRGNNGDVELEYTGSSRVLTISEDECLEDSVSEIKNTQNPYTLFKDNIRSNLNDMYRGQTYKYEIRNDLELIFKNINEHVVKTLRSLYRDYSTLNSVQRLYTMVIDSERVDLLDIESIKNVAKEDYNSNFTFKEGEENQMTKSILQGLVYANFKIYTIELLLRGYFALDLFYNPDDMPNQFPQRVKSAFENDFEDYPDYISKINDIIKYDSIPLQYTSMMEKIYTEVVSEMGLIFEDAKRTAFSLFALEGNDFVYFISPDEDLTTQLLNRYLKGKKYVVNTYFLNQETGEELPRRTNLSALPDELEYQPQRFRLSHLTRLDDVEIDDRFEFAELDITEVNASRQILNYYGRIEEDGSPNYYENSDSLPLVAKTSGSVSQTLLFPIYGEFNRNEGFNVSEIKRSQTLSVIPIFDSDSEDTIVDEFISKYTMFSDLNDIIIATISNEVAKQAPQILTAFASTKDAIRMTFQSLKNSEKTFDNDDKALELSISNYPEESATNPDFSNIARKMALQTVPLILKGIAEKFDTNTQIGSTIRTGADLAGIYIPPQIASLIAFGISNFTIPPNPIGLMYLATGYLEPKERKRIKEMVNNRNTKQDVATGDTDSILEQLENVNRIVEEQMRQEELDIYTSVIETFINEYKAIEDLYFEGGYPEDTDGYPQPKDGRNRDDVFPTRDLTSITESAFSPSGSLSERLEQLITRASDLLLQYALLIGFNLLDNEEFSDDAIEKELFVQEDFTKFKLFLQNSLKANFWICEGLNMIALIYYNTNPAVEDVYPPPQEKPVDIDVTYNPRSGGKSATDIYSNYESKRDSEKRNYLEVVDKTATKTRHKLAKWKYSSHEIFDQTETYTYDIWTQLITYVSDKVIPYLKDNGY